MKIFYSLLIYFLIISGASAKDLYVAINGNDSVTYPDNNMERPWSTIGHGVKTMQAGDTLNIRGGDYIENVTIPSGGSSEGGYKVIRNCPDEIPVLDAKNGARGIDILNNVNYVKIMGLEIKNATDWGITNWEARSNTYITIQNCNIHDNGDGNGANSKYEGGIALHSASGRSLENIIIDNNQIHHNYRPGLFFYCNGCVVSNITISNNLIYRNPSAMRNEGDVHPLWLSGIERAIVFNNYVYFGQKNARICEKSNYNTFYNNVFGFNGEYGLDINYNCSNNIFKNNVFAYNNIGGVGIKSAGSNNNIFWNNVFYKNGYIDIFQLQGSGEGATGTEIQNNTFVGGSALSALYREYGAWGKHDYNNYYDLRKAIGGKDGVKAVEEWIGTGKAEQNSRNADPGFPMGSSLDFNTAAPDLLNSGNMPGNCNKIGLCSNFVDNRKVFPYRPLAVHSASYDTPGASRTIDNMVYVSSSSNAWQSNSLSGWIIYEVVAGPKLIKYVGLNGGCKSAYYSPKDFHIGVSSTGTQDGDFTTVLSATYIDPSGDDWSMQAQWFELGDTANAKYIKFTIDNSQKDYSRATNPNVQVAEFYVIGPRESSELVKTIPAPTGLRVIDK